MPHKPLSQILDLSSAAGSAQIAVSSQSGDCSVSDEFQSTHLRLTRLVNSELTAACMHGPVTVLTPLLTSPTCNCNWEQLHGTVDKPAKERYQSDAGSPLYRPYKFGV